MLIQQDFTHYCRKWCEHRRLSPLDLALMADISQRHLSYLETGKSRPSREMISKLSEAMDIPPRERNRLYQAAGFSVNMQKPQLKNKTCNRFNKRCHVCWHIMIFTRR